MLLEVLAAAEPGEPGDVFSDDEFWIKKVYASNEFPEELRTMIRLGASWTSHTEALARVTADDKIGSGKRGYVGDILAVDIVGINIEEVAVGGIGGD